MRAIHKLIPGLLFIFSMPSAFSTNIDESNPMLIHGSSKEMFASKYIDFKGMPACYLACYSDHQDNAIYSVGNNIYVMGDIRVSGKYKGSVCEPTNFKDKDISKDATFKHLCSKKIKACKGGLCWVGGDTGDWFGIKPIGKLDPIPNKK